MSKSPITTDDRLPNPYPGKDMREDLFEAGGVTVVEAALATGLSVDAIEAFLDGTARVDADFDLRLGRYFGFSPGYFLRLQIAHNLEEVERSAGDEIERIRPHVWQVA